MNGRDRNDFGSSLLELFRVEAEHQTAVLTAELLELEHYPPANDSMEKLLRAAHSLKGAARIVNLQSAVRILHAMEDCLLAAQGGTLQLQSADIDLLLRGVDWLQQSSKAAEADPAAWQAAHAAELQSFVSELQKLAERTGDLPIRPARQEGRAAAPAGDATRRDLPVPRRGRDLPERVLRLTAESLDQLLGLAGESLVESRWLRPFSESMRRLKDLHLEVEQSFQEACTAAGDAGTAGRAPEALAEASEKLAECRQFLAEKLEELDLYDRRSAQLSHRLYLEVLRARMRPFGDALRRFPRMVRDLARALGKEVRLEISGEQTQVDRDILERLEAPLAHLVRNAVDHGCETPAARRKAGKPSEGCIRIEAQHNAGALLVAVTDDGPGIDPRALRRLIVAKKLVTPSAASKLSQSALLEFLFLPGFTMKASVTEISGRGIGLDAVQHLVKSVRGAVDVSTAPGGGTRFQLQLPLTLSVLRALLVKIGGEPYAVPLSRISRPVSLPRNRLQTVAGRTCFTLESQQIGLLPADQVLECEPAASGAELSVVVLGDRSRRYGLIVDRFLGERELVVQPLDQRLGKVKDIQAAALMEDGSPVLIIDVDELVDSMERLIARGAPAQDGHEGPGATRRKRKRILAVDDSPAVRELERKLLSAHGYQTDVAVDGIEGWNAVRTGHYDLVIADVDMPRMGGIELAARVKQDPDLKSLPVLIIAYQDRHDDRRRGMEAGVDLYLTKGSFHDESLLRAVSDLIGGSDP